MSNLEENWFDDASNAAETEVVPEKNKLHLKKTGDDVDWKKVRNELEKIEFTGWATREGNDGGVEKTAKLMNELLAL